MARGSDGAVSQDQGARQADCSGGDCPSYQTAAAAASAAAQLTVQIAASTGAFGEDLPPGTFVSPEAVEHFKAATLARALGHAANTPDKLQDQWTITKRFRADLIAEFGGMADNYTVLEIGSYFGYTTRLLSQLFGRVISVDVMPQFIEANREYNRDKPNILYLKFHTQDDWGLFAQNTIDVVFLDASHDYEAVAQDIQNCIRLPSVSYVIFDDYGAEHGVRAAVHEAVTRGQLRPVRAMGEPGPWRLADGREIADPEGIACEVVRG